MAFSLSSPSMRFAQIRAKTSVLTSIDRIKSIYQNFSELSRSEIQNIQRPNFRVVFP